MCREPSIQNLHCLYFSNKPNESISLHWRIGLLISPNTFYDSSHVSFSIGAQLEICEWIVRVREMPASKRTQVEFSIHHESVEQRASQKEIPNVIYRCCVLLFSVSVAISILKQHISTEKNHAELKARLPGGSMLTFRDRAFLIGCS